MIAPKYDRSGMPIYAQVALVIRQRVEAGFWNVGSRIPAIEELESEFGVARVTIRKAMEMMKTEGLLEAKAGRGTFVIGRPHKKYWLNLTDDFAEIIDSIKDNTVESVLLQEKVAPPYVAKHEGKLASSYVFSRSVQYAKGQPFAVVNLHLSKNVFNKERKELVRSVTLAKIIEMDGVDLSHAYQTVTVGVADLEIAELLNIGLGEPTADCRLVLTDCCDVAIYIASIHYNRSCFSLRQDLIKENAMDNI
jgi:GntR family transcriptional regulator